MFLWMIIEEEITLNSRLVVRPTTIHPGLRKFIDKEFRINQIISSGSCNRDGTNVVTFPNAVVVERWEITPETGTLTKYNLTEEEIREYFYIEN